MSIPWYEEKETWWEEEIILNNRVSHIYDDFVNKTQEEKLTLQDIENLYYEELINSQDWKIWIFTYEDAESMKLWEIKYFINCDRTPVLLKRINVSIPCAKNDYELLDYLNVNKPTIYWKIAWIFSKDYILQVTKKYFYKCILDRIYRRKIWELDDSDLFINHDILRWIDMFVEKKRSLFYPSYIKKNELDGYTLEELENMDYDGVDEKRVMEYWYTDILDMEVWETMYFQDEYNPYLIKRIKKTVPEGSLYKDYETFDYDIWINYPKKYIGSYSGFISKKEDKRLTPKAFYKYVLFEEYRYRVIMLEKLTKPTKEDLLTMIKYREKMNLYNYYSSNILIGEERWIDVNKKSGHRFSYTCY